jgi:hypothetical protein
MKTFLLFLCIFLLFSCSSIRYIDIQVLKPAEIAYPYPVDKFYIIYPKKAIVASNIEIDAPFYVQFMESFTNSLQQTLKESPLFENSEISLIKNIDSLKSEVWNRTNEKMLTNICTMESIHLKDSVYKISNPDNWFIRLEMRYSINLIIKNLNFKDSIKSYLLTDTIKWDSQSFSYYLDTSTVIINKQAISKELPEHVAQLLAYKIAPFWETQERKLFYSGNSIMRKGYHAFTENNNQDALKYWKYAYNNGVKKLAAQACYNIALCYETTDSLTEAKSWIDKAIELKQDSAFKEYKVLLEKRIDENKQINKQLKSM